MKEKPLDKTAYWVDMADYDFETALAMRDTRRYLYVGFMCHQTVEKMLKAYWSRVREDLPLKTHSLARLAQLSGLDAMMTEEQNAFLDQLEPLNIEARYPSYKERLLRSLTDERCALLLAQTDALRTWIRNKL